MAEIIEWVVQGIYDIVSWIQDPNTSPKKRKERRKRKEKQDE